MFALTLICLAFVCQVSAFDELSNKQHERIRRYSNYDHDCGVFHTCYMQYWTLMTPSDGKPTDFCTAGKKAEECFSKKNQFCHRMTEKEIQDVEIAVPIYCSGICEDFQTCFRQYQALMTPSGDQPTDFCDVGKKAEECFSKKYQFCHNMPDNEIQVVKSAVTVYCSARKNCAGLAKCSGQVQLSIMKGTITVKDHCELLQKIDQCFEEDKECHVTPAPSLTADVDSVCKLLRKYNNVAISN